MNLFANGVKHEFAKRYPLSDWQKSNRIKKLIDKENVDDLIFTQINNGHSLLIGRLGGTEGRFIGAYLKNFSEINRINSLFRKKPNIKNFERRKKEIQLNAGFFYNEDKEASDFVEIYVDCLKNTDILGGWGYSFTWPETFALVNHRLKVINKEFTAPWVETYKTQNISALKTPWSHSLENKKVLVISPFSKSIISQHKIIEKVFPGIFYPKFTLQTITAPLTSGALEFQKNSWFELLDKIKTEINSCDFEIALISCGSYSYPLARHVQKLGKIGIHCGGALQLYFGIMGNRWNSSSEIIKFQNTSWIRPSKEETPRGANLIEDACYW
jgi:hypothetical protein